MTRRAFAASSSSLLVAPLLPFAGGAASAQAVRGAIDAHCHVFNAADLPITGFVRRVVFEDYADQVSSTQLSLPSPLAGLVATVVGFLGQAGVISADEELAMLRGPESGFAPPFDPKSSEIVEQAGDALRAVLSPETSFVDANAALADLSTEDVDAFRSAVQLELEVEGEDADSSAFVDEFAAMARTLFNSFGIVGRTLRWAAWLRAPRMSLVDEMIRIYSPSGEVSMFTPALVDFGAWLEDDPASSLEQQIAVMEEVQRQTVIQHRILLHCYAPFDPLQHLIAASRNLSPTVLDLLKSAIAEKGFIGVKIYPPMGFMPAGNASGGNSYPEGIELAADADFGAKLDSALGGLFSWAEENQVPLLAHAANSNGSGPDYSQRANPAHWRAVLERFPKLHICLAHFGRFVKADGSPNWEDSVVALLADYPHVYADLSYHPAALASQSGRDAAIAGLRRVFAEAPGVDSRLVYGSDWIMMGREAGHESYLDELASLLREAGGSPAQWERIHRLNAAGFLGLSAGSRSRQRLEAWYSKAGLDPGLLSQFD
jgi:predicted TIM-barrel fold metal-dependent hydrolase